MDTSLEQFRETTATDAFALQSSKLLRVRLEEVTIQARQGAMVAYQGDVRFEHAGHGGLGRFIKKAATGEGLTLMKMSGRGEVFLADAAQDVHLVHLQEDALTVNAKNLLAFDAGIDWDIQRVKGVSGMLGAGLFNTSLKGTGWVAILSDGAPVLLDVGSAPTFADPQAAISWSGGVSTSIKTDVGLKDLMGRSSGEAVQIAFSGSGWVLVQPSEGRPEPVAGGKEGGGGGLGGLLNG